MFFAFLTSCDLCTRAVLLSLALPKQVCSRNMQLILCRGRIEEELLLLQSKNQFDLESLTSAASFQSEAALCWMDELISRIQFSQVALYAAVAVVLLGFWDAYMVTADISRIYIEF